MKTEITQFFRSTFKKAGLLLIIPVSLLSLSSCEKNSGEITPNSAVAATFKQMYPTVTNAKWYEIQTWQVAKFEVNNFDTEAWYDIPGTWGLTTVDIDLLSAPTEVQTSFAAGKYANWKVDDVYKVDRVGIKTIYVLLVEQKNPLSAVITVKELHYTPTGYLTREFDNKSSDISFVPQVIPANLLTDVMTKYPSAQVVDYYFDFTIGATHIYIYDGTMYRELLYDQGSVWISTSWDVTQVPAAVSEAFQGSPYSNYTIDSLRYVITPGDVDYYFYQLSSAGKSAILKIKPDGTILEF